MASMANILKRDGSRTDDNPPRRRRGLLFILFVAVAAAVLAFAFSPSPFFSVEQGELGLVLRFGRVAKVAEPGLNTKIPFIDTVVKMSTRTHKQTFESLTSYSRDVQQASIQLSINYRIKPEATEAIYTRFGTDYAARVIEPVVPQRLKEVFGQYQAQTVVADRVKLGQEVENAILSSVPPDIIIENVQIENIDFSQAYESAIEAAAQAEAEVRKTRYELERDKVQAERRVVVAKAEAEAVRQRAQADADAVRLRGDAEAAAIAAKAKAFLDNPGYVNLIAVEKWTGTLPTTQVPGSALPFIQIPSGGTALPR